MQGANIWFIANFKYEARLLWNFTAGFFFYLIIPSIVNLNVGESHLNSLQVVSKSLYIHIYAVSTGYWNYEMFFLSKYNAGKCGWLLHSYILALWKRTKNRLKYSESSRVFAYF